MEPHIHDSLWDALQSHIVFVLVALAIMTSILILTVFLEKALLGKAEQTIPKNSAKKVSVIGLLSAVGGVLTLIEIPLFIFYQLDFSEVPALIAGFLMGPVAGVIVELLKVVIHVLFHGSHSAFVGEFAMFISGCFLVIPASIVFRKGKTVKAALLGLLSGVLCLVVLGALFNGFYLIPAFAKLYAGADVSEIIRMASEKIPAITNIWTLVLFATTPFNLIKGVTMSLIAFLIYKPLGAVFHNL